MPERPLLVLPRAVQSVERAKKTGGGDPIRVPDRPRQGVRLGPRFDALRAAFEADRVRLQASAHGLASEQVIVLESVAPIDDLLSAVRRVAGLEWLGEVEEDDLPPDEDFFVLNKKTLAVTTKPMTGRLFLVFSNQQALQQILSMWTTWLATGILPVGFAPWRKLFEHLKDVRLWGVKDRLLETGVLEDWRERATRGQQTVPCEIEMWHRGNANRQKLARDRVAVLVAELQGTITADSSIHGIGYHALRAELPIGAVRALFEHSGQDAALVQCEQIQFFRAAGQMCTTTPTLDDETLDFGGAEQAPPTAKPIVALFDGLPLQNHQRLAGRLFIDDPDDFESDYPVAERVHGTAMASLIVNGDLNLSSNQPINRLLYARPILRPDAQAWIVPRPETVPGLPVDVIYRAVQRLFEPDGQSPPAAPTVCVINLSIGIVDRPFDNSLSPLARLVDWLAWKYRVLFIVSAGNYPHSITLPIGSVALATVSPEELQRRLIQSIAADTRNRRLLSPAEGVNILTVGATHHDASDDTTAAPGRSPFVAASLPSLINAQGLGYRRAIKPDVLFPGGRVLLIDGPSDASECSFDVYRQTRPPGNAVAGPGREGETGYRRHTVGTSNAAAIASRSSHYIHDMLDELEREPGGEVIKEVSRSLWIKALLAHGAHWGAAASVFADALLTKQNKKQYRDYVARLLGYGTSDEARILNCTSQRVTVLAAGVLKVDQAHEHRMPLPPSLSGKTGLRRIIGSLAWFTPINTEHRGWRRAHLWFAEPTSKLRTKRSEADWKAAQRGTLQHEIFEGERAAAFVDGSDLVLKVNCRADAGELADPVPYALAITLEVADSIGIDIYAEVRARVHARVRVPSVP